MNNIQKALMEVLKEVSFGEEIEEDFKDNIRDNIKIVFRDENAVRLILEKVLNDIIHKELWNEIVQFKVRINEAIENIVTDQLDVKKIAAATMVKKLSDMKTILEHEDE